MRAAVRIVATVALLTLLSAYPYLPGSYDPLAVPLATTAQVGTGAAFVLALLELVRFALRARARSRHVTAATSRRLRRATIVALGLALFVTSGTAYASGGLAFGLAAIGGSLLLIAALRQRPLEEFAPGGRNAVLPLALAVVPVAALGLQVLFATPLRNGARERGMANAGPLVDALDRHRARYGRYPQSLTGLSPDYPVSVVGVDRYAYTPHDDTYTLHFELPVPLWHAPGTRELVAYAPDGRYMVLSHAAWHVERAPGSIGDRQGWYAAHDTAQPGWRAFLFD